jgi:hypothetical protein
MGAPYGHSLEKTSALYQLHTLYGTEFSPIMDIYFEHEIYFYDARNFLAYLAEFLENPERSKTHVFDQQKYATASKRCLQLCLCSHHILPKGAILKSAHRDKALRRSKPWLWRRRLGIHGWALKARHRQKVRRWKSLKTEPGTSGGSYARDEYRRSVVYGWSLNLLPSLLEKSAISLELAKVLRRRTFTTMAQRFPRRKRLAKEAIMRYLLRVGSVSG